LVKTEPILFESSLQLNSSKQLHFSEAGCIFYRQCPLQTDNT